ncbi:MAG TPA: inositol monophosphatase family protein [Alphaproteobacteria bacterium]|nr:inositol monophosphatase family protein [Alphaproteobacteria bacterium]
MAKGTITVNPKLALMRKLCAKVAPAFRRQFGEMARIQANPVHGPKLFDDTRNGIISILKEELSATGTPLVIDAEKVTLPETCWLIEPLAGRRNFLHARQPVSVHFAYIENGSVLMGGVFFPAEDLLVHVAPGAGVMGPDRLRVAGRADVAHTMAMLPWKTADVVAMKLMEKLDAVEAHTRKTGHTLFDVIEVAAGRADVSIATRTTPLEALLANLLLAESAGVATDMQGAPLSTESTGIVAGNLKTQAKFLDLIK